MNILEFFPYLALVEFRTNGIHIKRGLGVLMLIPTWAITTVTKGVLDRLIKEHCPNLKVIETNRSILA